MNKKVSVFVRDMLWTEMIVEEDHNSISFSLSRPDIISYNPNNEGENIYPSFETIAVFIETYYNDNINIVEYRAEIDDPTIVIYDKNTIIRINNSNNSSAEITKDLEAMAEVLSPTPINTRFELLDL